MMKRLFYILIFSILLIFENQSSACTAFCLKTGKEIFLAKNLDWEIENGYVFLNERGLNKSILNTDPFNKSTFQWQSKYRSITFNQFGKEFPLGGMNEQGLAIEELNMSPVKLIRDSSKQMINEFQLVQYLLDNCKSVDQTINCLKNFQCEPLFQTLHYIIADKTGNIIVVEFNGSKFDIYYCSKTGLPVLSNNNYNESLNYLSNFHGFGGNLPVKIRQGSNERFVTVANFLKLYYNQPPIDYSFQILDTVKQGDTRWSMIYDIRNLRVYFKFHRCETVKVFDFNSLTGMETISGLGGNLSDCNLTDNDGLNAVYAEENTKLISEVLSLYSSETGQVLNYNLQYQIADLGNLYLKKTIPYKLINELDSCIIELPDLNPLSYSDKVFADVADWNNYKIVAIGEATHGTKEFVELRHRILKYLVENHDFKALFYEFSFRKSLKINDFVLYGLGNIDTLLAGEYWIQNNAEFINIIKWIRTYNEDKNAEEKIYFFGIDNQTEALELEECMNYIEQNYASFYAANEILISEIKRLNKISYTDITNKDYQIRRKMFVELKSQAELFFPSKHFKNYIKDKIALQLIQSIINSHKFLYLYSTNNENIRDLQLATNVLSGSKWFEEKSNIVVFTHNAHIANNPDYYGKGQPAMGNYLANKIKDKYFAIATSFSTGKFTAVMMDSLGNDTEPLTCEINQSPACISTNYVLHQAKYNNFIFNIKELNSNSSLYKYINIKRPLIGVGDLFLGKVEKHFSDDRIIKLASAYSLLFYFKDTHSVTINQNEKK